MQISVVKDDELVYVDEQAYKVEVGDIADYIHAIQWDTAKKVGHIEYKADSRGIHQPNTKLVDFSQFEHLIDRWRIAKKTKDDAIEAERKNQEAARAEEQQVQTIERIEQEQVRKPVRRPKRPK